MSTSTIGNWLRAPGAVSVIRVASRREGMFEPGGSERQFQRALADAVWQPDIELHLT